MLDPARATSRAGARMSEPLLPPWAGVLVVVAHPDDESFGLGGVIDRMTSAGAAVHILCFTHGEASTLNEAGPGLGLRQLREAELARASTELGVASVTLLDYPDGGLADVPCADLAVRVADLVARYRPDGLLAFDDNGITSHPDHQAATRAAVACAAGAGLPVLAWALPADVADLLRAETGHPFAGRHPGELDLRVRVSRATQSRAAQLHASQLSPGALLWRRLELLGDHEHLRWLLPPRP